MVRCYKTKYLGFIIGEVEDDCIHDVLNVIATIKRKNILIDFFPLAYPYDIELRDFELKDINKIFEIDLKGKDDIINAYLFEIEKIKNATIN